MSASVTASFVVSTTKFGRALEHHELIDLRGDLGHDLNSRRAEPDQTDALAGQVHAVPRPIRGVVLLAGEGVDAGDVRVDGLRQRPHATDQVLGHQGCAALGLNRPGVGVLVVARGLHPGVQPDVTAQIEPVGDEVEVGKHFWSCRIPLGPRPLLTHLLGEREGVVAVFAVGPHTRIAVGQPRASDAVLGVEDEGVQADLTKVVQDREAGEAGPDHDGVDVGAGFGRGERSEGGIGQGRAKGESMVMCSVPSLGYAEAGCVVC